LTPIFNFAYFCALEVLLMNSRKLPCLLSLFSFSVFGLICVDAQSSPIPIFHADFNASTPADAAGSPAGIEANADVANLNAGTSIGSWALSGAGGGNPGGIVSNPAGTDNAFVFDNRVSAGAPNRITGLFDQSVDIAAGDTLSFQFEIFPTRQGNPEDGRQVRLALTDSGGTSSGSRAYVLILNESAGGPDKEFLFLDSSNSANSISLQTGVGFQNPAPGNYQEWGWADGNPISVVIDVLGQASSDGGALVSIDWNSDGNFEVSNFPINPRDVGVQNIDRFEFFYNNNTASGAYVDNIHVSFVPIPEPTTLAMCSLFGLALVIRRIRS